MIYGLDVAYPPSLATARRQWALGWRFYGGYVGGPRAAHTWTNAEFARLRRIGFVFIPIYVGRNLPWDAPWDFTFVQGVADGDEANILAGACGFDEHQPICLDVEANPGMGGLGQALLDYVDGWCQQVKMAGHPTIVYTSASIMIQVADHFDFKWGADWSGNKFRYNSPPYGLYDPSEPPPWDVWQFADNGLNGTVDLDSAVDGFPFATYTPPA